MTENVAKPHPAVEIGVYGPLRRGVRIHTLNIAIRCIKNDDNHVIGWEEHLTAACTGKTVYPHSFAWAAKHGANLCRKCFGGDR